MTDSIWGTWSPEDTRDVRHIALGDLHVWYLFRDGEIWIDHRYREELDPDALENLAQPPEPAEWARWAVGGESGEAHFSPVLPDLPVVVASEYPLMVIPGATIDIFTRIPIWLRISWGESRHVIAELPTLQLSKTWFGTPREGELAWWSSTKARRSLSGVEQKNYVVNCPIRITNSSSEDLNFEKFCFRVERLKIFSTQSELWADETLISYRGEDQHSDITMTGKLPEGIEKGTLMSPPRQEVHSSLATRTFKKILDEYSFFGR